MGCVIALKFNFLSSDIYLSKGTEGVPVRSCVQTELAQSSTAGTRVPSNREICYCVVKVFRQHGAERKLATNKAHIHKTIEKVQQRIEQAQSGSWTAGRALS
jgi:hypothetical protein